MAHPAAHNQGEHLLLIKEVSQTSACAQQGLGACWGAAEGVGGWGHVVGLAAFLQQRRSTFNPPPSCTLSPHTHTRHPQAMQMLAAAGTLEVDLRTGAVTAPGVPADPVATVQDREGASPATYTRCTAQPCHTPCASGGQHDWRTARLEGSKTASLP